MEKRIIEPQQAPKKTNQMPTIEEVETISNDLKAHQAKLLSLKQKKYVKLLKWNQTLFFDPVLGKIGEIVYHHSVWSHAMKPYYVRRWPYNDEPMIMQSYYIGGRQTLQESIQILITFTSDLLEGNIRCIRGKMEKAMEPKDGVREYFEAHRTELFTSAALEAQKQRQAAAIQAVQAEIDALELQIQQLQKETMKYDALWETLEKQNKGVKKNRSSRHQARYRPYQIESR